MKSIAQLSLSMLAGAFVLISTASAQPWRYIDRRGNVHYTSSPAELTPKQRERAMKALEAKREAAEARQAERAAETPEARERRMQARKRAIFGGEESLGRGGKIADKNGASDGKKAKRFAAAQGALKQAQAKTRGLQRQMKSLLQKRDIARRDAAAVPVVPKMRAKTAAEAAVKTLIQDIKTARVAEKAAHQAVNLAQ